MNMLFIKNIRVGFIISEIPRCLRCLYSVLGYFTLLRYQHTLYGSNLCPTACVPDALATEPPRQLIYIYIHIFI